MVGRFNLGALSDEEQEQWLLDVAYYSYFRGYDQLEDAFEKATDHAEFVRLWKLQAAYAWVCGAWQMNVQGEYEHYLRIQAADSGWVISEMTNVTDPEDIAQARDLADALNYCVMLCRSWDYTRQE